MADGSKKRIGDIRPGDKVVATDPSAATTKVEVVTLTHQHDDSNLLDVVVRTNVGDEVLHTTGNHPFYDETARRWVAAEKLVKGHHLHGMAGLNGIIVGLRTRPGHGLMYNLTVSNLHTYYVEAGDTPVLVHNANCGDHLVLGSRYHGLEDLTQQLGGRHLLRAEDWREQVVTAADLLKLGDSDVSVSFSLDGLPGQTPAEILHQAVVADMRGTATPTQWELATMKYAGVLDRIYWYQRGSLIPNPFVG